MNDLSPNAENLQKCLIYFSSVGYKIVKKEKILNKPYYFTQQCIYELSMKGIITEDGDNIRLN